MCCVQYCCGFLWMFKILHLSVHVLAALVDNSAPWCLVTVVLCPRLPGWAVMLCAHDRGRFWRGSLDGHLHLQSCRSVPACRFAYETFSKWKLDSWRQGYASRETQIVTNDSRKKLLTTSVLLHQNFLCIDLCISTVKWYLKILGKT